MNTTATIEPATPLITKTQFLAGIQCQKLVWTMCKAKHLIPPPDVAAQAIFDQGHEVGSLAKKLFTNSIEIGPGTDDLDELVRLTGEAIKARKPLFEAAFSYEGCYARADILVPADGDAWDLLEIKSSTSVKDVYISDVAFQAFVIEGAGLKIRRCILMLINSDFVRQGEVDPAKFFLRHDVTDQVLAVTHQIETQLNEMLATIRLTDQPDVKIGPHCDAPYTCPLHENCWSFLREANVTTLYRGGAKRFKLLADGVVHIKDIPDGFQLSNNQEIQRRAAFTGQPQVDKSAIITFLNQLKYPVSYLDFETFSAAIPPFDGVGPYRQIPFQFSLHVVRSPGAAPDHHSFLAAGIADPRPDFMLRLRATLPVDGSVVAYNAPFELGRLEECCEMLPTYQPWVAGIKSRIADLLLPFREFKYYHPKQEGSASMKSVLPALVSRSYDNLAIQEGGTASLEFLRVHFSDVSDSERQRVRQALELYCAQDTEGMIWIVNGLRKLVAA